MLKHECKKCGAYTPFVDKPGGLPLCIRCRQVWEEMEFQSLESVNSFLCMGGYPPLIGNITQTNQKYVVKYAIPYYAYQR